MNYIVKTLEKQTKWISKVVLYAVLAASISLISGGVLIHLNNPIGFLLIILAMWGFFLHFLCKFFEPDQHGLSLVRQSSELMQVFASIFFIIYFFVLLVITLAPLVFAYS